MSVCLFSEDRLSYTGYVQCQGSSSRCILPQWVCDGYDDCHNNWDEQTCGQLTFFFFLLARQPNGDDEVEIRCLHSCLSRTMSIASFVFSCKQFKSSCILLIHFLHGRPLLRLPGI